MTEASPAAVAAFYERFPYPHPPEDIDDLIRSARGPLWNVRDSFALYFPEQAPRTNLDILVAGCGTSHAARLAACLPEARVVGIDVSRASLEVSRGYARAHGLGNLEHHPLPIERVVELGRDFDHIDCQGVLHHLADPAAGLRALASVLRPRGAIGVMVYGRYGRVGVYMLQELCRRLKLGADTQSARLTQELLGTLSEHHPLRTLIPPGVTVPLEDVADMLLHPRDTAFDVDGVRALIDGAGLRFHRWMGQGQYDSMTSPMRGLPLARPISELDSWQRAAAMELYHGVIARHQLIVTHPERQPASELFEGDRLLRAIPRLSPHLHLARSPGRVVLSNLAHQVPIDLGGRAERLLPVIDRIDGSDDVGTIIIKLHAEGFWGDPGRTLDLIRFFFAADLIELSVPPAVSP